MVAPVRWIATGSLLAGAATVVGSLFVTWAKDGPGAVLGAAALWSRAPVALSVAAFALAALCVAAAFGVLLVVSFTELSWDLIDDPTTPDHVAAAGPAVAL